MLDLKTSWSHLINLDIHDATTRVCLKLTKANTFSVKSDVPPIMHVLGVDILCVSGEGEFYLIYFLCQTFGLF